MSFYVQRLSVVLIVMIVAATSADEVPKEDLRFRGKDFAYWRHLLRIELDPDIRKQTVAALVEFGKHGFGAEAASAIAGAIRINDSEGFIKVATFGLYNIGTDSIESLVDLLGHSHPRVRYYAAYRLRYFGDRAADAFPSLKRAAADNDEHVRGRALYALASVAPPDKHAETAQMLISALKNAGDDTFEQAMQTSQHPLHDIIHGIAELGPAAEGAAPLLKEIEASVQKTFGARPQTLGAPNSAMGRRIRDALNAIQH